MKSRLVTLALAVGLFCGPAVLQAQQRQVTGRVVNELTAEPVAAAAVSVIGTPTGAYTNSSGAFSVSVPNGPAQLRVSAVGYKTVTVEVGASQGTVEVKLAHDVLNLEGLVVTGQATGVARRNLANAVSTVAADQLNQAPSASVETQLAAKVPGASIQSNSGAPGGGNQVRLRGVSTVIGNTTPLYVVDGVIVSDRTLGSGANAVTGAGGGISSSQDQAPNRVADLNPSDIANIEILKGAAAAAIYGSKANNGVIVITTKRGQIGKPRYTLDQRFGVSRLSRKLGSRTFTDSATAVAAFGPAAAPYFANGSIPKVYDHEEELAGGSAPSRETQLGISGGSEDTRYYVSGLVKRDDGIVRGTYYDKYSLKVNLDQTINDRLGVELRTNALRSRTGRGFTGNDNTGTAYYTVLTGTPNFVNLGRNEDGIWNLNPFQNSNPFQTAALAKNDEEVSRFIGALSLKLDALERGAHTVRLIAVSGADYFSQKNVVYSPEELQFEPLDGFPGTSALSNASSAQLNTSLSAVHTYTPDHGWLSATLSLGTRFEYRNLDIARVRTRNLFAGQQNIGQGVDRLPEQSRELEKDWSIFAQEELLIGERLLLTAGLNMDRSSNNAETARWYLYPKGAASYRWGVDVGPLDEVKLRAAFGQSGNLPRYGQKFNNLNPGSIAGLQTLLLGGTTVSQDLRPERQTEIEGGVDFYLFNGRGGLELTAYNRRINDLLLNRSLAPSTGYTNALYNSNGQLSTRGVEAAVHAAPVQRASFDWTTRVTFSHDRSRVDSLDVPPFTPPNSGFGSLGAGRIEQGKSATQIVGRDTITFDDDPRCLESLGVQPGSGQCKKGTRIVTQVGDANPDFRMGFMNEFRYNAFRLASTVEWQKGGDIINLTGYLRDASQNTRDFDDPCTAATCNPGETKGQHRLRVYPARTIKTWIEDGSFVKLREVTLSYDVPTRYLSKSSVFSGVDRMSLSLSGRNLVTLTNYSGFDPEVSQFGSQAIRTNVDVAPYPPSRSLWLNINLSF